MNYLVRAFIVVGLLSSCETDSSCFCTETVTNTRYGEASVVEYWLDNCYEPFQQLTVYDWGSTLIDCR